MKSIRRFFEAMGIWVAVMPFLHFPVNVRNILYAITGVTIFIAAYLYLRKRIVAAKDKVEPTFVESVPQSINGSHAAHITPKKKHVSQQVKHDVMHDVANEGIETVPHSSAPQVSGIETLD